MENFEHLDISIDENSILNAMTLIDGFKLVTVFTPEALWQILYKAFKLTFVVEPTDRALKVSINFTPSNRFIGCVSALRAGNFKDWVVVGCHDDSPYGLAVTEYLKKFY